MYNDSIELKGNECYALFALREVISWHIFTVKGFKGFTHGFGPDKNNRITIR